MPNAPAKSEWMRYFSVKNCNKRPAPVPAIRVPPRGQAGIRVPPVGAGYSREIRAVGLRLIMGHYRAYGGPEPPPIDHQGIDDAFLEKASTTWYYDGGRWLQLQGAD